MTGNDSALYSRLVAHGESRSALAVAFLWGIAEATFFFLVPDIYLGFIALFNWRRGLLATAFTVVGALVGGFVMYVLAANNPLGMAEFLTRIPLINGEMVISVGEQIRTGGLLPLIMRPLQGIPYKVYAVQAGAQGFSLGLFLFLTILVRLERILPFVLLSAVIGVVFRSFVQHHTKLILGLYAAVWCGIYFVYFLRIR